MRQQARESRSKKYLPKNGLHSHDDDDAHGGAHGGVHGARDAHDGGGGDRVHDDGGASKKIASLQMILNKKTV